jgi:hypothetical protein
MTHKEDGSTLSVIRNEGGIKVSHCDEKINEVASYMGNAFRLGVSHFNKKMTRLTRDEFDKAIEAPIELYTELYDIYGKGYRSVGDRVPNA